MSIQGTWGSGRGSILLDYTWHLFSLVNLNLPERVHLVSIWFTSKLRTLVAILILHTETYSPLQISSSQSARNLLYMSNKAHLYCRGYKKQEFKMRALISCEVSISNQLALSLHFGIKFYLNRVVTQILSPVALGVIAVSSNQAATVPHCEPAAIGTRRWIQRCTLTLEAGQDLGC